ncbi:MAG: helix-turn-helix transcriptional regulator [Dehalococcoidia bacterium]|nr:helix-turn-helix transcriptional regulator [Dehalococcoidia bacterium]MYI86005.1 helix-turn-helix transcriptional regulator [Dehalococcoidia bacterium]
MRKRPAVRLKLEVLWKRLEALNASQAWLAREVGMSHGYLSTLIKERRAPSGPLRRRLQAALGISDFDELFELEERDENE